MFKGSEDQLKRYRDYPMQITPHKKQETQGALSCSPEKHV